VSIKRERRRTDAKTKTQETLASNGREGGGELRQMLERYLGWKISRRWDEERRKGTGGK
jgi:hypothetical protein